MNTLVASHPYFYMSVILNFEKRIMYELTDKPNPGMWPSTTS